jgi:hypothetical protein
MRESVRALTFVMFIVGGIASGFAQAQEAADALHPVFEAPAVSVPVRARRRSPSHALRNRIRELQ